MALSPRCFRGLSSNGTCEFLLTLTRGSRCLPIGRDSREERRSVGSACYFHLIASMGIEQPLVAFE
jgi:hypothetical protein